LRAMLLTSFESLPVLNIDVFVLGLVGSVNVFA
jgi:hypothetical protein